MQIKLNWIEVQNFKKLKKFRAEFGGESAIVIGRNGTGKTTLADAYFWLLTDSDSEQQTKFNLLELTGDGNPIDQQDAQVEAEFWIGSKLIKLKKVYRQKWTKKRGAAQAELTGHTTEHFFDGVPVSKTKYNKKLSELVDPDIIRSICDVHYFAGRLKPERRREILMQIAGSVSDTDICDQFGAAELLDLLGDKTPEDLKKILSLEMREIKKQLSSLPERIDELRKMMPDVEGQDEEKIVAKIATLQECIDAKKNEILAIRSGLAVTELKKDLADLEREIDGLTDNRLKEYQAHIDSINNALSVISRISRSIDELQNRMRSSAERKDELLRQWHEVNGNQFVAADTCFACGQKLPPDQISKQRDEFNGLKASELRKIDGQGRELNEQIKKITDKIAEYERSKDVAAETRKQHEAAIAAVRDEIEAKKLPLAQRRDEIRAKIEQQHKDIGPEIEAVETALSELEREKGQLESIKLDFVQIEKCSRRIEERQQQLRDVGAAHEEIERKLNMLDEFSQWKSNYIEQNVNDKFTLTRWQLFEQQVNGGVREICEPMFQGVPYSTDLNTGAKINLGIDCVKTLQTHYDISMPVWIDNAESVTEWKIDGDMQFIKLSAAANVEKLDVVND